MNRLPTVALKGQTNHLLLLHFLKLFFAFFRDHVAEVEKGGVHLVAMWTLTTRCSHFSYQMIINMP